MISARNAESDQSGPLQIRAYRNWGVTDAGRYGKADTEMTDNLSSTPHSAPLGLGVTDAARAAGVGRTAIYEALKSGTLVARKLGRRTIILVDDLNAWLTSLPRM